MVKEIDKVIGIALGIIAIVLIAITFFVDLASATFKTANITVESANTTFYGLSFTGHYGSYSSSWSNLTSGLTGSQLSKVSGGVDMIYASMATMILAAIFAALGIITVFGKSSGTIKKLSLLFPIISAILIIMTIVLYYEGATTITGALTSGIGLTTTISLAVGAYLAIVALILELLIVIFNFLGFGKAKASKN